MMAVASGAQFRAATPAARDDRSRGIFHTDRHIYAIGDVHGDLGLFVALMTRVTRVATYDADYDSWSWVGGNALIIMLGDLTDRNRGTIPDADPETDLSEVDEEEQ